MFEGVGIGHLTGSVKVIKNNLFTDLIIPRKGRTLSQMFFQPFESHQEFIFCSRHLLFPALVLLAPEIIITAPVIVGGLAALFAISGGLIRFGNKKAGTFLLDCAKFLINDLCQSIIDLVVSPISALFMLTRGISSVLDATGIVKGPKVVEESISPSFRM